MREKKEAILLSYFSSCSPFSRPTCMQDQKRERKEKKEVPKVPPFLLIPPHKITRSTYATFPNMKEKKEKKTTWHCDVQEVRPRWRLAGVCVKVEEDGAKDGEEDPPRVALVGVRDREAEVRGQGGGRRIGLEAEKRFLYIKVRGGKGFWLHSR